MKTLKTIQETSPVLKGILQYLELAVTMFFLPFFTELGEPILESLMGIISEIIEFSLNWGRDFGNTVLQSEWFNKLWDTINQNIQNVLTNLIEGFIPVQLSLVDPMFEFIKAFIDTFNQNASTIKKMLVEGVKTYTQMIDESFVKTMVSLGKMVFTWIKQNAENLKNTFSHLFSALEQGFDIVAHTMSKVRDTIVITLTLFGSITGALIAYRAMLVATALSLGIQQIGIPQAVAIGLGAGQATGQVAGMAIVASFIDPLSIEKFRDCIPQFSAGGKIKHVPGGRFGIAQEAGQGEFIIPQSKLKLFRGDNNFIVRINGNIYDKPALERTLKDLELECPIRID